MGAMSVKSKASRKITENTRMIPAVKNKRTNNDTLKVWLSGKWLAEWGFVFGAVLTVESTNESIVLRLVEKGYCIGELVSSTRKQKKQLLQVSRVGRNLCIEVYGQTLKKAGFEIGEDFIATLEQGVITIRGFKSTVL